MSCFWGEGKVKELDCRVNFTTCPTEVSDYEMVYQTQVCFYAYLFTFFFTNLRNSATFFTDKWRSQLFIDYIEPVVPIHVVFFVISCLIKNELLKTHAIGTLTSSMIAAII